MARTAWLCLGVAGNPMVYDDIFPWISQWFGMIQMEPRLEACPNGLLRTVMEVIPSYRSELSPLLDQK